MADWFTNASQDVSGAIGGLLTPAGGFINNVLGSTQDKSTNTTTTTPDVSSQTSSKTLTIAISVVAVIVVVIVAIVLLKGNKK